MLLPKILRPISFLLFTLMVFGAQAQVANDQATRQAILGGLPEGVTADTASADVIAQAALDLVFSMEGERADNLYQVMVSLEELTREGVFTAAPRFGIKNPPNRLYTRVLNLASSALDVTYTTYHGVTVQHIMELTAAMREAQNFVNGAESNAITRR